MGTELSVIPKGAPLAELQGYAQEFMKSGLFQDMRSVAECLVKVQAGAELGISPFASVNGLHIIQGKVTLSAGLIATLIKRSGKYNYRVTKHTTEVCEATFYENGEECGVSGFTIEDAKLAGLMSNPMWNKYRRNMLFARMISNGAKWYCADVFGGPVYTPDEINNSIMMDIDGNVINSRFEQETPISKPAQAITRPKGWRDNPEVIEACNSAVAEFQTTDNTVKPLPYQYSDLITQEQIDAVNAKCDKLGIDRPDDMSGWTKGEGKEFYLGLAGVVPLTVATNKEHIQ